MRRYASFFEWSDRWRKELGVVEELLLAVERELGIKLHSPENFEPDPPDCICVNNTGESVAIEVTEVVCQEAAHQNALGNDVYRYWAPGELTAQVESQLRNKDSKKFRGGPYSDIYACLFTDEPAITFSEALGELSQTDFGPFRNLTGAFLLFSYCPEKKYYPVINLKIKSLNK